MLSQANILLNTTVTALDVFALSRDDVLLGCLPLSPCVRADLCHECRPASGGDSRSDAQDVCVVIVPEATCSRDPEKIVAWAKQRIAGHKYPRVVCFVDAFPLGPSGKVLKRRLEEMVVAELTSVSTGGGH